MHRSPRLRRSQLLGSALAAVTLALSATGSAAAGDAPNTRGVESGDATGAPVTRSYEAPRPVGRDTGRKIG